LDYQGLLVWQEERSMDPLTPQQQQFVIENLDWAFNTICWRAHRKYPTFALNRDDLRSMGTFGAGAVRTALRTGRRRFVPHVRVEARDGHARRFPAAQRLRQTANLVKGSLRRPRPPLTLPAACRKISAMRAKRCFASPKLEALC
jgi:hypothetical protein